MLYRTAKVIFIKNCHYEVKQFISQNFKMLDPVMPAFHGNISFLTVFLQPGARKQDIGLSYNEVICIIT